MVTGIDDAVAFVQEKGRWLCQRPCPGKLLRTEMPSPAPGCAAKVTRDCGRDQ
jgi:hypothetical protein